MKILDSEIDIDTNKSLLFKEYRTFFVMVVVTALMDAVSTMYFMELIGPHVEMNPIVRVLSFSYGTLAGPLLGKLYQLFGIWVISVITPRLTRFICLMVSLFNVYAFVMNMTVSI